MSSLVELHRVLIIDDHPLFREALRSAINKTYPDTQFTDARGIDEALCALADETSFDLALLDLNIPGVQGYEGLIRLRKTYPRLPVLVVSGLEDTSTIQKSLSFGAAGFVPKSVGSETLADAIAAVLEGSVYTPECMADGAVDPMSDEHSELIARISSLTPQQLRVLHMLRVGMQNKQIAAELDVGATTVKAHVSEILRKLNVYSRTQAVIEVAKLDHVALDDISADTNGAV